VEEVWDEKYEKSNEIVDKGTKKINRWMI